MTLISKLFSFSSFVSGKTVSTNTDPSGSPASVPGWQGEEGSKPVCSHGQNIVPNPDPSGAGAFPRCCSPVHEV